MQHPQITEINYYWANRLNCSPSVFEQCGTIVLPYEQNSGYSCIIITRTYKQSILQVPPKIVQLVTDKLNIARIVTAEDIMALLVDEEIELEQSSSRSVADRLTFKFGWRDFIWYFPPQANLPPPDRRVRLLNNSDRRALDDLMAACTEKERELGNIRLDQEFSLGLFENNRILAAASLIFDGDEIADVGVITHPEYRKRGLGKSVVSDSIRRGIDHKRIMQYTTQEKNIGSKLLAESIGFWLYAVEEGLYLE